MPSSTCACPKSGVFNCVVVCGCLTYLCFYLICFLFNVLYINQAVSFLIWIVSHLSLWELYSLLCSMDMLIVEGRWWHICAHFVSGEMMPYGQSYHILFLYVPLQCKSHYLLRYVPFSVLFSYGVLYFNIELELYHRKHFCNKYSFFSWYSVLFHNWKIQIQT